MRRSSPLPIGLLLLALAPAAARADDAPRADGAGPRLHVDQKNILFDEVIQGRILDLRLPVHNRGDAPLLLTRAEPSCGCTVMALPKEPIPPGGKVELLLRFDSTEKMGAQSLQILLYSNDPTQTDMGRFCTQLFLQGDVRSLYRITPVGAFFGEFVRGVAADERVITVLGQNEARRGFTARLKSVAPDYLEVTTEPVPGGEGGRPKGLRVRVRLLPHAPQGELQHTVELETDVPEQPRVRLQIVGVVTGRVVGPDHVQLLRIARAVGAERRAPIERRDGREGLRVVRIETDLPWLAVTAEPLNAQRVDIRVSVPVDAPPGPFSGLIRVVLDDPEHPLVTFPVFGHVMGRVRVEPALLRVDAAATVSEVSVRGGPITGARLEPVDAPFTAEVVPPDAPDGPTRVLVRRREGAAASGARLIIETGVAGEEQVPVLIETR